MKKNRKLVRQQLDNSLKRFRLLQDISPPAKGWIKAIREALGMSGRQLGERMGVSKQRTSSIEKQEITGSATIKTMRKIAEQMDCVFVYGFVPRMSLENTVRTQAKLIAFNRLSRVSHTMRLEDQALSKKENEQVLSKMVEELANELPSNLWDKYDKF